MPKIDIKGVTPMTDTVHSINLIVTNPKVRSGRPCIAGTGLEVAVIAIARTVHQQPPEQIAEDYDLSLGQVHAALAYYYENQTAMDTLIEAQRKLGEAMKEGRVGSRHKPLSG